MKRANFPARKLVRQKIALAGLDSRIKNPEKAFKNSALFRRHKDESRDFGTMVTMKDMHREYLPEYQELLQQEKANLVSNMERRQFMRFNYCNLCNEFMDLNQELISVNEIRTSFEPCSDGECRDSTYTCLITYHLSCYLESCTEHKELTIG